MYYLFYIVHKKDICHIKFIVDAYENMMALSTIDETRGKIQITIAHDLLDDCLKILNDLEARFDMKRLENEDPTQTQGRY